MLINSVYLNVYEELLSYYPRFYRDVREMCAILQAEGNVADGLVNGIEQVFSNARVETADETTISRLENFLGIKLQRTGTLDERRRIVKSYFVGAGKTSSKMLKEMITAYTNADSTIKFEAADDDGNNKLYIEFDRGTEAEIYLDDIQALIKAKIPAHIDYAVTMAYGISVTAIHGLSLQTGTTITIETEAIQ